MLRRRSELINRMTMLTAAAVSACAVANHQTGDSVPYKIVERQRIECLVNRGAYCVPDSGYYVTIYSSDEDTSIVVKIGYRFGFSGHGFIIEQGACTLPASNPRLITRSDERHFEGEDWLVARFALNNGCEIAILFKPQPTDGNSFGFMIAAVRPCFDRRRCDEGRLPLR